MHPPPSPSPHRIVMVAFEDAQILDITGPLEVFARTSRWLAERTDGATAAYSIELVAEHAGPLRTSGGLVLQIGRTLDEVDGADTLLIAGGIGYRRLIDRPEFIATLKRLAEKSGRVASICTGALLIGAAGLLDRRRATTHWAYVETLRERSPTALVEPDSIFVRDGNIYTSAGVTAGMDLALALVEEDWGKSVALSVAQQLVLYLKRPGGQSQFSRLLESQRLDDWLGRLEAWLIDHLSDELPVAALADRCGLSLRQLTRRLRAEADVSPSRFVEQLRVEQARRQLSERNSNLKAVARRCGFKDVQRMRRAFQRQLGISPAEYRQRFC